VEALGLWAMAQVEFIALLERLGLTGPQRAAVVGVILGRMAAPGSELATQRWLCERSALGELLDVDFEAMSLMQLYRAADVLMRHREALEKAVFARVSELFGLDWSVTFYDLDQYLLSKARRRATRRPDAATPRRSAATVRCSPWGWCSTAAASCAARRCSTATWSKATPWRGCSRAWGRRPGPWW
jgi:hypothetical protein